MITRDELSDFVKFCQVKYQVELNQVIIDDFIHSMNSNKNSEADGQSLNTHLIGCSSNNIECTHLTFDSAKCNECPY